MRCKVLSASENLVFKMLLFTAASRHCMTIYRIKTMTFRKPLHLYSMQMIYACTRYYLLALFKINFNVPLTTMFDFVSLFLLFLSFCANNYVRNELMRCIMHLINVHIFIQFFPF